MIGQIGNHFSTIENVRFEMEGVYLDESARDELWGRLEPMLSMNNAATHRLLKEDQAPGEDALRKMEYYENVTGSSYGGAASGAGGYCAWYNGQDTYVLHFGLEASDTQWHLLPGFAMPDASPRGFGLS